MNEILQQLGRLLLGSVPTIVFMVLLYGIYTALVHKPLVRLLTERHAKTEGAVEKSRVDISMATARTAEYEQRLREARLAVFKAQEEHRQRALQRRTELVAQARARAQAEIEQARAGFEQDKEAAKSGLQAEAGRLATEIIRTVLQPATAQAPAGGQ